MCIVPVLMATFGFAFFKKLVWDLADEVYECCFPGLLGFCSMDLHSPQHIVLNHLCTLSELVGASSIRHRRFFGTSHFLFLCELRTPAKQRIATESLTPSGHRRWPQFKLNYCGWRLHVYSI